MTARCPFSSRRGFLGGAGALAAALGAGPAVAAASAAPSLKNPAAREAFWGAHQGGILTPPQNHMYFAAFDLISGKPSDVAGLLRTWTAAASRLTAGQTAEPIADNPNKPGVDSAEALGLGPARLTLTFGFGAGLFTRTGLTGRRPEALIDLPRFTGDHQMDPARTGGDLSVQACADDPQVAFHAVRQLARLGYDTARLRWTQTGFSSSLAGGGTPRNLMGFKDGTQNPPPPENAARVVWATEGLAWMRGGSYAVARRIRIALEHWDNTDAGFQEQTIGRRKISGAPLSGEHEFDPLDLAAADADGNPVIPENAHVRMASAAANEGAAILRRGYSYNDGTNLTAERWPPWRQGLEYDAGLFFICYQSDPRSGFVKIFDRMSKFDALNQFTTHTGGGLFACPAGCHEDGFIGQALFDAA